MAMLNRWVEMKKELNQRPKRKRPFMASRCNSLVACEIWRKQVMKEITRGVAQIQNAGLGEHRVRDLNDEINKLLREKGHWEDRIKELGGNDYKEQAQRTVDNQGVELPGAQGYKYFGAAKDLPGVRELFQKEIPAAPRKTRAMLYRNVDFDYYGFRDEEDGVILAKEAQMEELLREQAIDEWKSVNHPEQKKRRKVDNEEDGHGSSSLYQVDKLYSVDKMSLQEFATIHQSPDPLFETYAYKPPQEELEKIMLERKRMALLEKYAGLDLVEAEKEAQDALQDA